MRNNSLYNINQNKILEDKLTNQMTNQSKIARPSDDPVVAIRALRLRTNVTTVSQYYDKNAKDADQWISVTADALTTIDEVLNHLYEEATGSANKYLTADDLEIVMTQMKSLTQEFYASGNVDYAGRYVFSGYRTDLPITFTAEDIKEMGKHPVSYEIHESKGFADISTIEYTDFNVLDTDIGGDGMLPDKTSYEQSITNSTLYRLRLSYDSLDGGSLSITSNGKMSTVFMDKNSNPLPVKNVNGELQDADGNPLTMNAGTGQYEYANGQPVTDAAGNLLDQAGNPVLDMANQPVPLTAVPAQYDEAEKAYQAIANGTEKGMVFIPTTGEVVFSKDYYDANFAEGDTFQISYDKSSWLEGDINPAHYFMCKETKDIGDGKSKTVIYNETTKDQDIYYDVGFNQQIQVNTLATEVFTHDVRRDMDDFQHCLDQLRGIETKISDIEKKMGELPVDSDEYKNWNKKLEAAKKADSLIRENIHTKFENQITKYQKYQNDNNIAITNNAARGSRLDLISTRLMNQKATFKDLQTDNEGIDVTQVAVELSSSELTYQAALMATSKIMQTNLMNYI